MSNTIIVGEKVKSLREQKNLSTADLAERSGLSEEKIIYIENSKEVPALAPLLKISRGLGVRLGTFLDDSETLGPVVTRAEDRPASVSLTNAAGISGQNNMDYFSLAQNKSGRHMEPYFVTLGPDTNKDQAESAHEGEELVFVIDGEVELTYGKEKYTLKKGDSIFFDSIVKHHLQAANGKAAQFVGVIYTPV
ncbi:MAG: cupin domain-containing protein [Paludibacteraceae bacterium]|nr:cupin domain-containing protein [Paludibacteraceae bacterium]